MFVLAMYLVRAEFIQLHVCQNNARKRFIDLPKVYLLGLHVKLFQKLIAGRFGGNRVLDGFQSGIREPCT